MYLQNIAFQSYHEPIQAVLQNNKQFDTGNVNDVDSFEDGDEADGF